MSNAAKNFDILSASYIIILTKLFSNLYLAKFLDTSTKSFFPCNNKKICCVKSKACSMYQKCADILLSYHCVALNANVLLHSLLIILTRSRNYNLIATRLDCVIKPTVSTSTYSYSVHCYVISNNAVTLEAIVHRHRYPKDIARRPLMSAVSPRPFLVGGDLKHDGGRENTPRAEDTFRVWAELPLMVWKLDVGKKQSG